MSGLVERQARAEPNPFHGDLRLPGAYCDGLAQTHDQWNQRRATANDSPQQEKRTQSRFGCEGRLTVSIHRNPRVAQ